MQKASKMALKRVLAMLLVVVTLMGFIPGTSGLVSMAEAAQVGSSASDIHIGTHYSKGDWCLKRGAGTDYFTRYSLVKFPNGANHPTEYEVLGTIDVFPTAVNNPLDFYKNANGGSGLWWYGSSDSSVRKQGHRMTAVDYAAHGYSGYGMCMYTNYTTWGGMTDAQFDLVAARILENYAKSKGIGPGDEDYDKYYKYDSSNKLICDWSSKAHDPDDLNTQFGSRIDAASGDRSSKSRAICESGDLINALVMILSKGDSWGQYLWGKEDAQFDLSESNWQTEFDKWCEYIFADTSDPIMTIDDFIQEADADYRILCEPGMIWSLADNSFSVAGTMRDLFRFATENDGASTASSDNIMWCFSNIVRQRLAYALHQTCDEFWTYDRATLTEKKNEGMSIGDALTEAFNAVKNEQNEMFYAVEDNRASDKEPKAKAIYDAVVNGSSSGGLVANGAYALGILAPYTFISDFEDRTRLEIKKTSNLPGSNKWQFTIELKDEDGNPISGEFDGVVFDASGKATIELVAGSTKAITRLPLNCQVTVTEDDADPSAYETKVNGTVSATWTETLSEPKTYSVVFDNSDGTPTEFRVSKSVTGSGDKSKEWEFEVKFEGDVTGASYTIGSTDTPITGDTVTFKLKHGEVAVFHDLDESVKYTVTEKEANSDGYTTSPGATIQGSVGAKPAAAFVNDKPGDDDDDDDDDDDIIYKVDSKTGKGVGPAWFHIEGQADESVGGYFVKADYPSDENGLVHLQWSNPNSGDGTYCPPGQYTVTEKVAPEGYELTTEAQHLVLHPDGVTHSGPLMFKNDKKIPIELLKTDSTGNPLPGAIFAVYKDGKRIDTVQSGPDGIARFSGRDGDGLSEGYYEFEEIQAPAGYVIPKEHRVGVQVDPTDLSSGSPITLSMKNYESTTIKIYKGVNGTNEPLAGAMFEVMIDGTSIGEFGPSGPDGYITIDTDSVGKYLADYEDGWTLSVRETVAPDGYLLDDDDWKVFEIEAGRTEIVVPFTDTKYPEIKIYKRDLNDPTKLLEGATFEVWIDGNSIGDYETGPDGSITIDYETYGKFLHEDGDDKLFDVVVQEKRAPSGYMITDAGKQEKPLMRGDKLLIFEFDDWKYPVIKIIKRDINHPETLLPGATFEVWIDSTSIGDYTTGPDGTITIDYETYKRFLKEDGTDDERVFDISVQEKTAPEGYLITDNSKHTKPVERGQELVEFEFDDMKYPEIWIRKLDVDTGMPLAGCTFNVSIDGTEFSKQYQTVAATPENPEGWYKITYDEFERFLGDIGGDVLDLRGYTVSVTEVTPPKHYNLDKQNGSAAGQEYTLTAQLGANQNHIEFTFEDAHYRSIKVRKIDSETGWGLKNAQFHLWSDQLDYPNNDGKNAVDITSVTNEDGWVYFYNLPNGWYYLEEIQAPNGYDIEGEWEGGDAIMDSNTKSRITRFQITSSSGHTDVGNYGDGDNKDYCQACEADDRANMHWLTFTRKNDPQTGIRILKRDVYTNAPVAGAIFKITPKAPLTDPAFTVETNSEGVAVIENGLKAGTYEIQETYVPKPYILDSTVHTVEIKNQHDAYEVPLYNAAEGVLYIQKLDAVTHEPLAGAYFKITDADGKVINNGNSVGPTDSSIGTYITDEYGRITTEPMMPGFYMLKEVAELVCRYTYNEMCRVREPRIFAV